MKTIFQSILKTLEARRAAGLSIVLWPREAEQMFQALADAKGEIDARGIELAAEALARLTPRHRTSVSLPVGGGTSVLFAEVAEDSGTIAALAADFSEFLRYAEWLPLDLQRRLAAAGDQLCRIGEALLAIEGSLDARRPSP